jgi:hypothetical protein
MVTYKTLSQYSPGKAEKNHKNLVRTVSLWAKIQTQNLSNTKGCQLFNCNIHLTQLILSTAFLTKLTFKSEFENNYVTYLFLFSMIYFLFLNSRALTPGRKHNHNDWLALKIIMYVYICYLPIHTQQIKHTCSSLSL